MYKKNISLALAFMLMHGALLAQDIKQPQPEKKPQPVTQDAKGSVSGTPISERKTEMSAEDINKNPKLLADVSMAENKKVIKERKPGERAYEYKGTKFTQVPLIGDLEYYGKDHDKMLEYTKKYMASRQRTFAAVMQRNTSGKVFVTMDKIFDRYDIPHELKYLSVIESALNNRALSPVGAYGPWQFMPSTGRMMGLKVSSSVDERADLVKSTHAACKYLSYLYNMFDDWLLVIAAYNSGPRPVLNAIKKTGKNDFWSIKRFLPSETQNHVMAFVATATAFELLPMYAATGVPAHFDWKELYKKDGKTSGLLPGKEETNPFKKKFTKTDLERMAIYKINNPMSLDVICSSLDIDPELMYRWNYDYLMFLDEYKPGDVYNLRIPKDKAEQFLEKKDHLTRLSVKQREY